MTYRVLLDTGPLVAIVSERDHQHAACVDQLRRLTPPLLTCWPVITEAAWLLRSDFGAVQRMLAGFDTGLLRLLPIDEAATPWISRFLVRYADRGVQLADACLVYDANAGTYTKLARWGYWSPSSGQPGIGDVTLGTVA